MPLSTADYLALTQSPTFQGIPLATVQASGEPSWFKQMELFQETAGRLCALTMLLATEQALHTYAGVIDHVQLQWYQGRDDDGDPFLDFSLYVNDESFISEVNHLGNDLRDAIDAIDEGEALHVLRQAGDDLPPQLIFPILEFINRKVFSGKISSAEQTVALAIEHVGDLRAHIDHEALDRQTPHSHASRQAPRM